MSGWRWAPGKRVSGLNGLAELAELADDRALGRRLNPPEAHGPEPQNERRRIVRFQWDGRFDPAQISADVPDEIARAVFEMPDRFVLSCGYSAFRPNWPVRKPLAEAYGQALIAATADLKWRERALALAKGLQDTLFLNTTTIRKIVTEMIPAATGD